MQNSLLLWTSQATVNIHDFFNVSEMSLKWIACFWNASIDLEGEKVFLKALETPHGSSEILMGPTPLLRKRMDCLLIEKVSVLVDVLIQSSFKGSGVRHIQILDQSKQDYSRFKLRFACRALDHNPFHMHQAHLEGNAPEALS